MDRFMKFAGNRWRYTNDASPSTSPTSKHNTCPKNAVSSSPNSAHAPRATSASVTSAAPAENPLLTEKPSPHVSMYGSLGRGVTFKARRPTQEDRHVVWEGVIQNVCTGVYGVFDGHGGAMAAEYCQRELLAVLLSHATWSSRNPDIKSALRHAVERLEAGVVRMTRARGTYDGTTLCVVVVYGRKGWFCNVGDSRCALVKGNGAYAQLSHDHRVGESEERERLVQAGCVVRRSRLMGGIKNLEVSRALGDREFKEGRNSDGLVAAPEVEEFRVGAEEALLMVATDALWDIEFLGNEGICGQAIKEGDVGVVAGDVVREALKWRNGDNVSLVLVRLHADWAVVERGERGREPATGFAVGKKDIGMGRGVYWEGEMSGAASRSSGKRAGRTFGRFR